MREAPAHCRCVLLLLVCEWASLLSPSILKFVSSSKTAGLRFLFLLLARPAWRTECQIRLIDFRFAMTCIFGQELLRGYVRKKGRSLLKKDKLQKLSHTR